MHLGVLPHRAYSSDWHQVMFYLFGPIKEILGGTKFRYNEEVKLFMQQGQDEQKQTFWKGIMELPER
jgi:hypothetical protein